MPSTLTEHEWRTLRMTVEGAEELAAEGSVALARDCLVAGVSRAERLQRAGEPWAEELRREYLQALTVLELRSAAAGRPGLTAPDQCHPTGSKSGGPGAGEALESE